MGNFEILKQEVLAKSDSANWTSAAAEWKVVGYFEDVTCSENCICGQEKLRHVFTIENRRNGNVISNIGSVCVKQFERDDLVKQMNCLTEASRLVKASREKGDLTKVPLKSPYYSRKLLGFFYENGAFEPNEHNSYDAFNDYQFMLDMFHKRDEPTKKQLKKTHMLLRYQIQPFLKTLIAGGVLR